MAQILTSKTLRIDGMTCVNCETRIERKLKGINGVAKAKVSYGSSSVQVTFYPNVITLATIQQSIEKLGYKVVEGERGVEQVSRIAKALGIAIILFALYMMFSHFGLLNIFNAFPLAEAGMGYGMLFSIGLLTSFHCIAMCGGINLSQCMPHSSEHVDTGRFTSLRPSFLYNLGRVFSYTFIGGVVGAIGSVVSFSETVKGIVQLVAGIFMVIMGLNMLNIFPWLRRFGPRMPKVFTRKMNEDSTNNHGPIYIGLLNGLMPCGPLQAMQLYALSTGNPLKGALSMLLFSLGTVPFMFGLGAISSILSKKYTRKIMTAGAALIVVLGVSMFQSGMALSGFFAATTSVNAQDSTAALIAIDDNVQIITTQLSPRSYEPITVKAGVPVKWTIHAENGVVNGCNNEIIIPEYNITKKLVAGDNIIEFTPDKSGTFPYSCWMGMIRSSITVVEDAI